MKEYKYDVAFSFLQEDEELAVQLNDLLRDRLSTFLYSKKQGELAGTDGEETFNNVFSAESRIVVVLYRDGWGDTPWTRIEETAIKNRAYDEGYDFTIFIPLDHPPSVPQYLPRTRIWASIDRWGIEGTASVIEARVQEFGGIPHEETIEEHVARRKRQIDGEQQRKQFLATEDGVKAAKDEGIIRWIEICKNPFCVSVDWVCMYRNTLNESSLDICVWKGAPRRSGRHTVYESQRYSCKSYNFDIDSSGNRGWRETDRSQLLASVKVAEFSIKLLIDHIYKVELGKRA